MPTGAVKSLCGVSPKKPASLVFAKAVRGEQPYPVSHAEMLANVAALEAIMKSVTSRQVESVATPSIAL
jgi:hypothetical protein